DKGVHTALEAVGELMQEQDLRDIKVVIAGDGDATYAARLHELVKNLGITAVVKFMGSVAKEKLPHVYAQADILLFPSIWEEPFGRTLVEGMASGLAIISTRTGGAGEIVKDGHNALVFEAGNAIELARAIESLRRSPQLRQRLALKAQETALEQFALPRMVDEIESYLTSLES
ncbi:MAG: glycosyltransferase family 4 protein, partial [Chloroflexota bacterium]